VSDFELTERNVLAPLTGLSLVEGAICGTAPTLSIYVGAAKEVGGRLADGRARGHVVHNPMTILHRPIVDAIEQDCPWT
jgi:hypothetical protein